ncbi:MAG: holo-ACP synthase [Eubacterium sp.]|nr:holo-ACP synthase [Eubacterium sp.]
MAVFGIGTDILQLNRMRSEILQESDPFVRSTFTEKERKEAARRKDPRLYFAGRFAAKEAVYKALRLTPELVDLSEIEILTTSSGAPRVILHDRMLAYKNQQGIRKIHISLSNEEEMVLAFALAETE